MTTTGRLGKWPLVALVTIALAGSPAAAGDGTVTAAHGMVVSVSPPASDVGVEILKAGGDAVDSAVATALVLAVTWPSAGNIGGGGFMMIYPGPGQKPVCIEYRETAPRAATLRMLEHYARMDGHLVCATPGTVGGLALAHQRYGRLPWRQLVLPAVRLARDGFPVDDALARSLNDALRRPNAMAELQRVSALLLCCGLPTAAPRAAGLGGSRHTTVTAELQRVFAPPGGRRAWRAGDRLVQPELARTLQQIADGGPDAFYRGRIADQIVAEMMAGGGLIAKEDLAGYRAQVRRPIHATYRGYDVYGPPPPSSGGICLAEMLNILENFDLGGRPRVSPLSRSGRGAGGEGGWPPEAVHLVIEAMRRAYCDRARHLGDADFVAVPPHLTSKDYAKKLAAEIDPAKATPSQSLAPEIPLAAEPRQTTHFSVVDKDGMAVANTYTLENGYGSRVMVRGAGFLLNNEMTDFNRVPGRTDRKGSIGTEANLIAPGKRMLSSQTPTLVCRQGRLVLATGSPGGRTIINTVLCTIINLVDYRMDIRRAVDAPRLNHEWFPDRTDFEGLKLPQYSAGIERLKRMGHQFNPKAPKQGDAHSIWVDPASGRYVGAADRRIDGKAAGY
jgi:gamma-glutamyltranspeptidase/glutathione hydrolase